MTSNTMVKGLKVNSWAREQSYVSPFITRDQEGVIVGPRAYSDIRALITFWPYTYRVASNNACLSCPLGVT